jgi:hypothetical protein
MMLSWYYKPNGFKVIRLADIQNNELSFGKCLFLTNKIQQKQISFAKR